jgi:hypothetical protein
MASSSGIARGAGKAEAGMDAAGASRAIGTAFWASAY